MADATPETWRPVVGFEGIYEVSDHGRVKRVGEGARHSGGARIGRIRKLQRITGGYLAVHLWRDGKQYPRLVHCLVAAAFIGPVPEGKEVNHCDGNKANNAAANLEYLTRGDNNRHAYRTGLRQPAPRPSGESHFNAKLTAEDVAEIRRRYQPWIYSTPRLAREFGVNAKTIHRIVTGKGWKESQ